MLFWNIHFIKNFQGKDNSVEVINRSLKSYNSNAKRAVLSASMTVEATFILPMFVFFSIILIGVINLINFQNSVNEKMYDTVRTLSKTEYAIEGSANSITATVMLNGEIGQSTARKMGIVGGVGGMVTIGSEFREDMVDFVVRYIAKTPFDMLNVMEIYCTQRMSVRKWIGNEDKGDGDNGSTTGDDILVFVTETGSVYHTNRNCTHIRLSIRQVEVRSIDTLRNTSGGKYYPCEKCALSEGACYITDTGDRFHGNKNCSGLKRSIFVIPLSEVGNRPLCLRCQG